MLVGCVRIDLVDDDLETERMRALNEGVEIRKGTERRIDVALVGDVVSEVTLRRLEEGR